MVQTVREFVNDSYQIISPNTPTVPLQGNDLQKGIQFFNELMQFYGGTGVLLTVPDEIVYNLSIGQTEVSFAAAGADVNQGRLIQIQNAWLLLQGVTYPLVDVSTNEFFAAYKYAPLVGLPLYIIMKPQTNRTVVTLYPGASQEYELHVYGKFEKPALTANDTMAGYSLYLTRFLKLALGKELARYKARMAAWTPQHEKDYLLAKDEMESVSTFNLDIDTPNENQLNGAYRVQAGV